MTAAYEANDACNDVILSLGHLNYIYIRPV